MKKRVLSALVLCLLLIPIIYLGGIYYYIAVGIISVIAFKEIITLPDFKKISTTIKIGSVIFYLPIVYCGVMSSDFSSLNYLYLILLFIYFFLPSLFYSKEDYKLKDGFYLLSLLLFIAVGFSSLIYARESSSIFIYLISIPIISDTFAMLTGMLIGKHKLCPSLSPKKTIEGSVGGFIVSTIVALILYTNLVGSISLTIVLVTMCLSIFSQIGDLIFSKIKRENDIKDYSNLIPGHGGALDRLDSILFVSVIYFILYSII